MDYKDLMRYTFKDFGNKKMYTIEFNNKILKYSGNKIYDNGRK